MNTFIQTLTTILPFVVLVIIWLAIRNIAGYFRDNKAANEERQQQLIDTLAEIRDELKELNKNNSQKL